MAATDTNDEIDSIMNEIEELQKEMAPEAPQAAPTVTAVVAEAEVVESSSDAEVDDILSEIQASAGNGAESGGLEDTLSEIKADTTSGGLLDEPVSESPTAEIPIDTEVNEEEIMPKAVHDKEEGNDGTLSLTLSGNMTLKLKYEFEGQEVTISFADQTLRVTMADGTEFKVPVASRTSQASNVKPFKKAV